MLTKKISKEEIIEDFEKIIKKLQRPVTYTDYHKYAKYGYTTMYRNFKDINVLNKMFGYDLKDVKNYEDLSGKKFGRLTVIKLDHKAKKKNGFIWLCKCECGNTVLVEGNRLKYGNTKSCGCYRVEKSKQAIENIREDSYKQIQKERIDGTFVRSLKQKKSRNNTTGYKGVSKTRNGKYRAYINIKRKQIYLGQFDTIEKAVEARKLGEEKYFKPIINKYEEKNSN